MTAGHCPSKSSINGSETKKDEQPNIHIVTKSPSDLTSASRYTSNAKIDDELESMLTLNQTFSFWDGDDDESVKSDCGMKGVVSKLANLW